MKLVILMRSNMKTAIIKKIRVLFIFSSILLHHFFALNICTFYRKQFSYLNLDQSLKPPVFNSFSVSHWTCINANFCMHVNACDFNIFQYRFYNAGLVHKIWYYTCIKQFWFIAETLSRVHLFPCKLLIISFL